MESRFKVPYPEYCWDKFDYDLKRLFRVNNVEYSAYNEVVDLVQKKIKEAKIDKEQKVLPSNDSSGDNIPF